MQLAQQVRVYEVMQEDRMISAGLGFRVSGSGFRV